MDESKSNTEKLFEAVRLGQTENIKKLLDLKGDINAKDENGSTPLHIATMLRKFVVQKQLLFEGAKPRLKDKNGRTPLHYAADHGDVETMKLLLANDASIKFTDKDGRTPLHHAVSNDHAKAVDLLVYVGASGKVKDEKGLSPSKLCNTKECKKILKQSELIIHGIETGVVKLEHKELQSKKTYKFKTVGLTIDVADDLGTNSMSFLCRRITPEFSGFKTLGPIDRQLLISDIFDYRISGIQFNAPVEVQIPIFKKPPPYEEICIKTDTKPDIDDSTVLTEPTNEGKDWTCKTKIDITALKAFTLVTRPKVETFACSSKGGTFTSEVDNHVKLEVEEETFGDKGKLSLNMTPSIPDKDEHPAIASAGMFYDIKHSSGQPNKDVTVTLPLPFEYKSEGEMLIMSRKNDPHPGQAPSEAWEVVEENPDIRRGRTTFKASHFSIFVPIEVLRKETNITRLKQDAEEIFQRSIRKEKTVVLMVMLKPVRMAGEFWFITVLEVLSPLKIHERKNDWFREGYGEVKGDITNEFDTFNGCFFKIDVRGNAIPKMNFHRLLEYHHHRDNYFVMHLKIRDPEEKQQALLDLSTSDTQEDLKVQYDHKTQLQVPLIDTSRKKDELEFKGFTRNSLLTKLAEELDDEDQWVNVSVYLGVYTEGDFATTSPEKKFEALVKWRDRCKHKSNLGVPMLVIALRRTDREDLVEFIQEELQKWLRDPAVEDKFLAWLKRKQGGMEAMQADEFPEPMSDEFLLTLVSQHGEELYQLAHTLDISQAELEDIKKDVFCATDEQRVLEFVCVSRDKQSNNVDAFEALLDAFTSANMEEAYRWSFDVAERWVEENVKHDNEYAVLLEEFLEELKWNKKPF